MRTPAGADDTRWPTYGVDTATAAKVPNDRRVPMGRACTDEGER
jgi:hypothetical protein